ncbi:glutathione transferase GstA [Methylobacterium sp. JK268]
MKLFYAPNTCSLSPHIVLRELGLPFDLVRVDNRAKTLPDRSDYRTINPKGYVAALQLANGDVLTEGPAIVQYLGDLRPDAGLVPPNGTWPRVRLQESLNFITSELHAASSPLFDPALPDDTRERFRSKLLKRLEIVAGDLAPTGHLLEGRFTVADAYLFTVLLWMDGFSIRLDPWPSIVTFMERIRARPSVQAALAAER